MRRAVTMSNDPPETRGVDSRLAVLESVAHDARNSFKKQEIILGRLERLETLLGVLQQGTEALRDSVSEIGGLSMRRGMTLEGVLQQVTELRSNHKEDTGEFSVGMRELRAEVESIRKDLSLSIEEVKRHQSESLEKVRNSAVDIEARARAEENRSRHNRLLWAVLGLAGTIITGLIGYIVSISGGG